MGMHSLVRREFETVEDVVIDVITVVERNQGKNQTNEIRNEVARLRDHVRSSRGLSSSLERHEESDFNHMSSNYKSMIVASEARFFSTLRYLTRLDEGAKVLLQNVDYTDEDVEGGVGRFN
jgi:hypothetical protein